MELITNILIEYLKYNKRIVVPKLGVFIVKQPSGNIIFSDLMRNDDGVLRSLLMAYGIKELEATGMVDRFVFEIHHATSQGNSFNIEGLGEFSPAENNTIKFKQKREPIIIGGNIKPPVEFLNAQKLRLQLAKKQRTSGTEAKSSDNAPKQRRNKRKEEESNISVVRPDDYLRGLKYDKNKSKKRGEDKSDNRGRSAVGSIFIVLLIAAAAIGIIWMLWQWTKGDTSYAPKVNHAIEQRVIESDSTTIIKADTLTTEVDSLNIEQALNSNISITE